MNEAILWLDVETSGLSLDENELLEVGALLTDIRGQVVAATYQSLVAPRSTLSQVIDSASPEARAMHERSGLWFDLWESDSRLPSPKTVSRELSELIKSHVGSGTVYPGGTSLNLDLSFVRMELPDVAKLLSHQVVDTTTLKLVGEELGGLDPYIRKGEHRAFSDAQDSLNEYRSYVSALDRLHTTD